MYIIVDGVRRAVAVREANHNVIGARIMRDGKMVGTKVLRIEDLLSPKETIVKDFRYLPIERGVREGDKMPEIVVTEYVPFQIPDLTPLMAVALVAE
jgi:hypothetical protein